MRPAKTMTSWGGYKSPPCPDCQGGMIYNRQTSNWVCLALKCDCTIHDPQAIHDEQFKSLQ